MKARIYRKHVANQQKAQAAAQQAACVTPAARAVAAVAHDLPSLLAVAVVDADTGRALAAHSNAPGFDPAKAAAHNAKVLRQKQKAVLALQLPDEAIEDILITLTHQLHLLKLSSDGRHFLYLAVPARDVSLASAREVLRARIAELG